MSSQITQQDWDNLNNDWLESYRNPTNVEPNVKESEGERHNYLYEVGKGTPKARFFMTDDGIGGTYGFWCPKSAILGVGEEQGKNYVRVADWCKMTIIEYNRN